LFSPIFSANFSQFEQLKKQQLLIGPKQVFFLSLPLEKYSLKKVVDSEFGVWWFDPVSFTYGQLQLWFYPHELYQELLVLCLHFHYLKLK
jgi:hypothetical protein